MLPFACLPYLGKPMKILSTEQIRSWDAYTIKHEPVSSANLVERAAAACVKWIRLHEMPAEVAVCCGPGNNGADGLAIARLLCAEGYDVKVYVIPGNFAADFLYHEQQLKDTGKAEITYLENEKLSFGKCKLIIDALFGTGINRALSGLSEQVTEAINHAACKVLSIDMPSGLPADFINAEQLNGLPIVKADHTLTFQVPKQSMMQAESFAYTGDFTVLEIGLDPAFLPTVQTREHYTCKADLNKDWFKRSKFSHKGTYGHALLIGGSYGKIGAALLMSRACLRAGAGLVTAYVPKVGYTIMQTAFAEAMVITDEELYEIRSFPSTVGFDVIGVGPGLGTHEQTIKAFAKWLPLQTQPLVLDADALNILSVLLKTGIKIPEYAVLTPHPKEFDRLAGTSRDSFERLEKLRAFAMQKQVVVVLKGAHTCVAAPDGTLYFNSTGNAGMATAGSGDVLTGMITSLLAQGMEPVHAAIHGVYLHGLAGDCAAALLSEQALIASDIIDHFGDAFKRMTNYQ